MAAATRVTLEELERWGRRLGAEAALQRAFVTLDGPLGAGKTTLVRAACEGAGVQGAVTSPTYTLVHRYDADEPIHHVDLYRIESVDELIELGWDDLLSGEGAVFVEWSDRARTFMPADRWEIRLTIPDAGEVRVVEAFARGDAPEMPVPA